MTDLDRSKPFGTVRGLGRVKYMQGDRFFDVSGNPVEADGGQEPSKGEAEQSSPDDYEEMSWHQLKRLVTDAGGEWTNSKEAIEFLRANDAGQNLS